MAINLSIRWSHPEASAALVRYARVDNTSSPVYTTVSPNPVVNPSINTITVATNIPNGQYEIQATPIYADGRSCAPEIRYTPACPGLIAINAYINGSNVVVQWTAESYIPKARITVNFPTGGQNVANYSNINTVNETIIPIPPGNNGSITVQGQSVCDEGSGFYSAFSNQITLSNNGGTSPIPAYYKRGNILDNLCNSSIVTLYTDGSFGLGKIVYQDSSLTIPLTGYTYLSEASTGHIYGMSTTTGEVLSDTGQACNVVVSNTILTNDYKINTVTGISGFTFPGAGLSVGQDYIGTRVGIGTYTIAVDVTANIGAFGKLRLLKNNILQECLDVSGNSTYTFSPLTVAATDIITISAETGSC